MRKHLAIVLALTVVAAWSCSGKKKGKACSTTKQCDTGASQGKLCESGKCKPCAADADCTADSEYGTGATCTNGRCVPCTPGDAGCSCASGSCGAQLVCDSTTSTCRAPTSCVELGCQPGQKCGWSQGTSDGCLNQCDPAYKWNANTSTCDELPKDCANDPADPTSILQDCTSQNRTCVTAAGTASCGACVTGYTTSGTDCVPQVMCSDLDCASQNRKCAGEPLASCTTCIKDYVDDNGTCRPVVTCADLNCSGNGICVAAKDTNNDGSLDTDAYCGTSADCTAANGHIWDPNLSTCLPCDCTGPGTTGTWETDRPSFQDNCICKTLPGYFFNDSTDSVDPCDADGDGWVRDSADTAINSGDDHVARNARCVLYEMNRLVLDNDPGRLAQTASSLTINVSDLVPGKTKLDLYEPDYLDDENKLLTLQTGSTPDPGLVDPYGGRHLLAKELNSLTKACISPLADDNRNNIPDVEEDSQSVAQFQQLNATDPTMAPFLKFSYFIGAYRGYFMPDNPSEVIDTTPGTFVRVGAYHIQEKSRVAGAPDGQRVPFAYDNSDPLSAGQNWRLCARNVDPNISASSTDETTMGFEPLTSAATNGFGGMNAASQFKCVEVATSTQVGTLQGHYQVRPAALWDGQTDASIGGNAMPDTTTSTLLYQFDECGAANTTPPGVNGPYAGPLANPSDPVLTCTAMQLSQLYNNTSDPIHNLSDRVVVGWALTRYLNNGKPRTDGVEGTDPSQPSYTSYQGGCINECADEASLIQSAQCSNFGTTGATCDDNGDNFGLLICE